jgi:hypothetical protein
MSYVYKGDLACMNINIVARDRSVDIFIARQRLCKHTTIPEQSLCNGYTRKDRGTVGSGVFRTVRPEAI